MATIREELVLVDRFTSVFASYLNKTRQAASAGTAAAASQKQLDGAARSAGVSLGQMAGAASNAASAQNNLDGAVERSSSSANRMGNAAEQAARSQDRMNRSMRAGQSAASGLERRIMGLARAYLGLRSAQAFVGLSDAMTQTKARLDRMNDGLQTTAQLQDMIYQAAQRSRGCYQETIDMVGKLGTLAGDAFSSNAELVAFAEQINKQFVLAGTSAQGAQAAMLQLTQAMSSGVLRGEELNSVLEQAPTIAQAIARYIGVTTGEMRELASQGKITSQVVKNALFAAAEETNAAFEAIPLTFGQAWTMASNAAVRSLQPALQRLNNLLNSELGRNALNGLIAGFELLGSAASGAVGLMERGAQLAADNWSVVEAVLGGVSAAALVAGGSMAKAAVVSATAWAAANLPLFLIAGSVALIIYMARQMGATWEEIGGVVGGIFGFMYAAAMNLFIVPTQNALARSANFWGNVFRNPLAAIKVLFLDAFTYILNHASKVAHAIEDLINGIPGMNVNLTSKIDGLYNRVAQASRNVKDASGWKEYVKAWDLVDYSVGVNIGRSAGRVLDNFNINDVLGNFSGTATDYGKLLDASGIPASLEGIGKDTAAIKRSVSLSEEDMKLLVDMAAREYVNNINLTAQTPVITINGQNTGNFQEDLQWLENSLKKILLEQSASHTDLSYA